MDPYIPRMACTIEKISKRRNVWLADSEDFVYIDSIVFAGRLNYQNSNTWFCMRGDWLLSNLRNRIQQQKKLSYITILKVETLNIPRTYFTLGPISKPTTSFRPNTSSNQQQQTRAPSNNDKRSSAEYVVTLLISHKLETFKSNLTFISISRRAVYYIFTENLMKKS